MIRCLIVDDEPIALRVLQAHLAKIPDVEVTAACTDALEALGVVRSTAVDLVFLDIEMPGLTGIGFVEALARPPRFVFTTAHRDYALQGFELDAVDYLLKPVSFPRLLRAVEKYRRLARGADGDGPAPAAPPALLVREDRRTVRLDVADVLYVESLGDYVRIRTAGRVHTTKLRLGELAAELAPHGFVRIHRSFVVALRHVDAFTPREVRVAGHALPVSRSYRRDALARLREDRA